MAMLSILALYNYDNTIFDQLYTPEDIDKPSLINHIMLETAELECIYPSTGFLKAAIGIWSSVRAMTWDRVNAAAQAEYNPIENYDRNETERIAGTNAHTGTDSTSITDSGSGTDTTKVAGYNSAVMVDSDSTISQSSRTGSQSLVHGETISDDHTKTSRIHGNIGVTTSQQMLEQEMQIAGKLNVYEYITQDFKQRFCITVY